MFIYDVYPSPTKYPHKVTRNGFGLISSFQDTYFGGTAIKTLTIGDWVEMEFTGKDAVIVYEQDPGNGAVLDVSLNGVVVGAIDTKLASSSFLSVTAGKACFSAPIIGARYGTNVIRLTNTQAKNATLCGAVYVDDFSDVSPVVFNVGRSSIAFSDVPDDIIDVYTRSSGLAILSMGVNDQLLARPLATFNAKIEKFLGGMRSVLGKCVVNDFMFSLPEANAYKKALRDRAWIYGFPFLDFGKQWLQNTVANIFLTYLDPDTIHPTDNGQEYIGNEICRVIGLPYTKGNGGYHYDFPKKTTTLLGDWAAFSASYESMMYQKSDDGIVSIQGTITTVLGQAAYSTIFVIAEPRARPDKILIFNVNSEHGTKEVEVHPDGSVKVGFTAIPAGDFLSFSGISFFCN
jgi:hypothetical protein